MYAMPVGLVGLGLMGSAIAGRLLAAGFSVRGFDVCADKVDRLTALGGVAAGSVADIAGTCSIVVLAVFDTGQVEHVVEGEAGLSGGVTRIVVCTSTCDPERISALAQRIGGRGVSLVEAPVSGTSVQVASGQAVGLIAGDPAAVQAAEAVLAAICPRRHFLGGAGNGGRAKLAVNLILGLNRAAIAEGIALAERLGLDRAAFLEVAKGSAAYSQVMDVKGALWAQDRYDTPMSRVDQSLKDFKLMLDMAQRMGQELPFATLYAQLLEECMARGEGALDNAAIIKAIRRRAAAGSS
ncbi:MAG: NAD(P)-dependent oxidoreductase [Burkholderiales bacterium]|nr:NAD(P)-dependent oxidoreductase [Burkholderiales bacterium]